eukprot:TRINITY_DN77152_c0_g1_i1.p1 TRINITY_DN77152_c0_g1~~TRINITY_DN77152_c0_g1_i1.p1  ORF type:complete len:394 (+),score=56.15 TRINITY_DN77152_c0_g1_i1:31-1182(+)
MMFAKRLLNNARGGSEEKDLRTVDSVLATAAKRVGEPSIPAASRQLEANGVKFAWQMALFSDNDWDQLGMSLGMKTAAKAELVDPTSSALSDSAQNYKCQDELSDRMRRFLLMPDADGGEAKPMRDISALFLGFLATPVEHRQSLLLALCELMALVSGLFLAAPFTFRTNTPPPLDVADIWVVPPTFADGRDALIMFVFVLDAHVAVFAVAMSLYVASAGFNANDSFCEAVMHVLGPLFAIFNFGVFFPLLALSFWQFFTDGTSPYLMLVNIVVICIFHNVVGGRTQKFFAEAIPLEVYHFPNWFLRVLRSNAKHMGTAHLLTEAGLKAAAERRACKLRAQMMLVDTDNDRPHDAANESDTSKAASEMEGRTQQHLLRVAPRP